MARKLSFIALVLVALYALAGFFVLPWWLESAIPQRLAQHMGWQATIENVRVNPFTMTIEATGLAADDNEGEPVLAFDRMYVNLGVLRLTTGLVALQNLELDEPFVRLDLQEDYSINLARDWQVNNSVAGDQPAKTGDSSSDPVKLFLDRLRIDGGEVVFRDFSQSEPEEFRISPLDLALNDLATWPREDSESDYYLEAAIGSQTIEWEGDLSIVPFYSTGYLRIADLSYATVSHFLKPYLPYTLRDGRLTVSSKYELSSGEQFSLSTSEGEVTLADLALAMAEDSETEVLSTARIHIPDVEFGLIDRKVSIGKVTVDDILLDMQRDEEGRLNLLEPFRNSDNTSGSDDGEQEEESESSPSDSPFRWSLAGVELKNGQVNWLDNQPDNAVDLTLEQLELSIGPLSQALGEPVDYQAALALAAGGRVTLNGQTTLQPFTLEAGISVSDLDLVQLDPYVGDFTNLALRDGLLTVDGNLALDSQQEPLTGTFSGNGQISSLDARLSDSGEHLMAWQNLRLEPLEYNLAPARLEIGTLTLSSPDVNIVRGQDGLHNLTRIMPDSGTASSEESDAPASGADSETDKNADSEGFIFRIGQIMLEGGEVSYADRTLEPDFSTRIDQLNGSLTGLSNVAPQQGKVSLLGRIGDVASMKLDGSIGTLGTEEVSNLTLKIDGVALPPLSPYLSRYLGYGIESGKLDLNLDYEIEGSRIDASNQILLDRMQLGSAVDSDQAVSAPVKLGLALLRDRKGLININLPITGDLADPQFSIAPIIVNTFIDLLVRAATSPFSMLGSLADMAGLTGEELRYVSFPPGKVEMASDDRKKLKALSEALGKRPSLLLKTRGAASPEVDGDYLRRQKLAEQIGISELPSAADRVARLESRYQAAGFDQPLDAYRQQIAGDEEAGPDELAWEKALISRLIPGVDLPQDALAELARARGLWLKKTLLEDYEVSDDQLFLLEPLLEAGEDESGAVTVSFELEAQ